MPIGDSSSSKDRRSTFVTIDRAIKICPACKGTLWIRYYDHRTIITVRSDIHIKLNVYRCHNSNCPLINRPFRPEMESRLAADYSRFGNDIACSVLQYSRPGTTKAEVHRLLANQGFPVSVRSLPNILRMYRDLTGERPEYTQEWQRVLVEQRFAILDVFCISLLAAAGKRGQEEYFFVRELLSGEILLGRHKISGSLDKFLADLFLDVCRLLAVPIIALTSDSLWMPNEVHKLFRQHGGGQAPHFHLPTSHQPWPSNTAKTLLQLVHDYNGDPAQYLEIEMPKLREEREILEDLEELDRIQKRR